MNILEVTSALAFAIPREEAKSRGPRGPTTNSDPTCDLNDLLDLHWRRLP